MKNLVEKLNAARNGGGLLFCGAGFSADCLNFAHDKTLGMAAQLCGLLKNALRKNGYTQALPSKLQNLAEIAVKQLGEHGLLELLQSQYDVCNTTADMGDILSFPWRRIYTTNYDNAIENALTKKNIPYRSFNNLDDIRHLTNKPLPIIHLHGFIKSWDIHNFGKSCVLTADSYSNIPDAIAMLLSQFREDCERAEFIAFIGYNMQDMHLADILRGQERMREKIFFINRAAAEPDIDIKMEQEKFGKPLYIGRSNFAANIRTALSRAAPKEPNLVSFKKYERCGASAEPAGTAALERLFIFGERDAALLAHDIDNGKHDYHVPLQMVELLEHDIKEGIKIAFISGGICDGKTFAVESLLRKISISRPIYTLNTAYDDLLEEAQNILKFAPEAVLVIENCFSLSEGVLTNLAARCAFKSYADFIQPRYQH